MIIYTFIIDFLYIRLTNTETHHYFRCLESVCAIGLVSIEPLPHLRKKRHRG